MFCLIQEHRSLDLYLSCSGVEASIHLFLVLMSSSLSKRLFAGMAAASLGLAVTACGGGDEKASSVEYDDSVTVGILHSLTGTMAISESTLVDTEKMAIDEINAAGGVEVDGKSYKIEYIVEDGASD